jgi:hypothetical protein
MALAITPVIIIGIILALIELYFVHADEAGLGWLRHGLHALPTMFLFVFISMNVSFVYGLINVTPAFWIDIAIRAIIGIIAMIKIAAAAAIAGRVGEKFGHILIIGVLIIAAPYAWELLACRLDFIKNLPLHGCPAPVAP